MFNQLKVNTFTKKLNLLITEPIFRKKLDDLIPKSFDSNIKVYMTTSSLHINKKNETQVDDLLIKINGNIIWYYYYSTGNFNEYGKLTKSNDNISTKYCYYTINNFLNRQDITTKTSTFIYDIDHNEIFRQSDIEIENYIMQNDTKQLLESNSKDNNFLKSEKQVKLRNGNILNSIQIKYKNENMKSYNCEKYFISNPNVNSTNYQKTKRLSKKNYLHYIKKMASTNV